MVKKSEEIVPQRVIFTVNHRNAKNAAGCYVARVVGKNSSDYIAQKQSSLLEYKSEDAYGIVTLWAQDRAQELGLELVVKTKAELDALLERGSTRPLQNTRKSSNLGMFQSTTTFNALLKAVLPYSEHQKIIGLLELGIEFAKKDLAEKEALKAKLSQADSILAQSMYDIYQNTGVCMSSSISSKTVLDEYKRLVAKG